MSVRELDERIRQALARFRLMIDYVSELKFAADGTATGKAIGNKDISPSVGWHLGFYSRPLDGATGIVAKIDGQGNSSVLIGYRNRQYEVALEKGEVAMANEAGASVKLNADGDIIETPKSGRKQYLGGNTSTQPAVLGNDLQTRLADLESKFLSHTHPFSGATASSCTAGGSTGTCSGTSSATTATLPQSGTNIKSSIVEVKP